MTTKNYQKEWRDKQKELGNKLKSFWINSEELQKLEEMKDFYSFKNLSDLIKSMILNHYEMYLSEKDSSVTTTELINEILRRIEHLEINVFNKPVKLVDTSKISQPIGSEPKKPVKSGTGKNYVKKTYENTNYDKEKIYEIVIEQYNKGNKGNEIRDILIDKGFTTIRGTEINRGFVDKRISELIGTKRLTKIE